MDTNTILASIQNWQAIRQNDTQLITYLGQGNCFGYDFTPPAIASGFIHAYPGIHGGQLKFFLIPSAYDNATYAKDIDLYTTVCPVMWAMGTNRIPTASARARINAWKNNYQTWVPVQTKTVDGIFMAFNIAVQDFEVQDTKLTLGLKGGGTTASPYVADLIVSNPTASAIYFDDYSQPVPPFSATAAASDFYLLQL